MNSLSYTFEQRLLQRKKKGNLRELKVYHETGIDFCSNDYLGLLHDGLLHPFVEEEGLRLKEKLKRGYGAGASRLLSGNSSYYEELENEIALFHGAEAGLIFNSGYFANLGLISAITRPGDTIIYDSGVHASVHDAIKLNRLNAFPFRHHDLGHLTKRLQKVKKNAFVCVESIYSTNGSQSDLRSIQQICAQFEAHLIVDEAHATGWLGDKGRGGVHSIGIQEEVLARVHTFSKALGVQGAIVLGSRHLKDILINYARPLIYTTALPLQTLMNIRSAYRALNQFPELPQRLCRLIEKFNTLSQEKELPFLFSKSPIQCFPIAGNEAARGLSFHLQSQGFHVLPLLSPTVRRGRECLRVCLHAFNNLEEITGLLDAICGEVKR